MAATVTNEGTTGRVLNVKGDAAYATGGYALGGAFLDAAAGAPVAVYGLNSGATILPEWDSTNKKVKFITRATGAEVANASDQSAITVKLLVED